MSSDRKLTSMTAEGEHLFTNSADQNVFDIGGRQVRVQHYLEGRISAFAG